MTSSRRTFLAQLITFTGRSGRANFWLSLLFCSFLYTAALLATLAMFARSHALLDIHPAGVAVAIANLLLFLVLYLFAAIRRLHDRGKSGHWLWLFAFMPAVLNFSSIALEQSIGLPPAAGLIVWLVALTLVGWGFVEFGFLPGVSGPNRFGPDPLAAPDHAPSGVATT
jgi:uncharacterized membrane protein YhaH (DUF805 family)